MNSTKNKKSAERKASDEEIRNAAKMEAMKANPLHSSYYVSQYEEFASTRFCGDLAICATVEADPIWSGGPFVMPGNGTGSRVHSPVTPEHWRTAFERYMQHEMHAGRNREVWTHFVDYVSWVGDMDPRYAALEPVDNPVFPYFAEWILDHPTRSRYWTEWREYFLPNGLAKLARKMERAFDFLKKQREKAAEAKAAQEALDSESELERALRDGFLCEEYQEYRRYAEITATLLPDAICDAALEFREEDLFKNTWVSPLDVLAQVELPVIDGKVAVVSPAVVKLGLLVVLHESAKRNADRARRVDFWYSGQGLDAIDPHEPEGRSALEWALGFHLPQGQKLEDAVDALIAIVEGDSDV